jgi:hypothetical protein
VQSFCTKQQLEEQAKHYRKIGLPGDMKAGYDNLRPAFVILRKTFPPNPGEDVEKCPSK